MTPKQIYLAAARMLNWMADFQEENGRKPRVAELSREFARLCPNANIEDSAMVILAMRDPYYTVQSHNGQSKRSH